MCGCTDTAFAKHNYSKKWHHYDDAYVASVAETAIVVRERECVYVCMCVCVCVYEYEYVYVERECVCVYVHVSLRGLRVCTFLCVGYVYVRLSVPPCMLSVHV
jgi:hypothetical protein